VHHPCQKRNMQTKHRAKLERAPDKRVALLVPK
jgi:hypothetical protein